MTVLLIRQQSVIVIVRDLGSFEQDKSKLDWEKFKEKEGIREELESHNKGKDGYVISGNHLSHFWAFFGVVVILVIFGHRVGCYTQLGKCHGALWTRKSYFVLSLTSLSELFALKSSADDLPIT